MNIAGKGLSSLLIQAMKEEELDNLNKDYNYYKSMLYMLNYNADFAALVRVDVVTTNEDLKESYISLTREELASIIEKRRLETHVKLSSIQQFSSSGADKI